MQKQASVLKIRKSSEELFNWLASLPVEIRVQEIREMWHKIKRSKYIVWTEQDGLILYPDETNRKILQDSRRSFSKHSRTHIRAT